MARKKTVSAKAARARTYRHAQQAVQRPDVGVQEEFQTRKPPKAYRFDSSLDPPYGVKFGSNFQPFVRKRTVSESDEDMIHEPETVKAYRDTWELGLHSYLSYLRDRFHLARDLLDQSGSVFVQINDDNLHLVRQVLDEVFSTKNFIVTIPARIYSIRWIWKRNP